MYVCHSSRIEHHPTKPKPPIHFITWSERVLLLAIELTPSATIHLYPVGRDKTKDPGDDSGCLCGCGIFRNIVA